MKLWDRLTVWWRGTPPSWTDIEGGWLIEVQDPAHTPRARVRAAARHPVAKWVGGAVGTIILAVITAAMLASLGLG